MKKLILTESQLRYIAEITLSDIAVEATNVNRNPTERTKRSAEIIRRGI